MRSILFLLLFFILAEGIAQKLEYKVRFHGIGDNREFASNKAYSQTILGERAGFEIGTTLEKNHRFRIGLSHLFEFGSEMDEQKPKLTAYYQYEDKQKTFYFGAFPRMDLISFPLVLLTDTFLYYRPNIEGLYGRYNWSWGHQSGFVDWTGRQTETRREAFMAGFSGEMRCHSFFFQNYLTLYHYAEMTLDVENIHIKDNMGMVLYVGSDLEKLVPLDKSYIKMGMIGSSIRERSVTDGFTNAASFTGELYGEKNSFALHAILHEGKGHHLMNGDRFYDADSYLRTDLIWKFINKEHIQGRFNLSFHLIEGNDLDQSQQLSLVYTFGND
ncbi:MAG: hypothetical protein ABFD10_06050 [Prolixibacteraceae bacterium]